MSNTYDITICDLHQFHFQSNVQMVLLVFFIGMDMVDMDMLDMDMVDMDILWTYNWIYIYEAAVTIIVVDIQVSSSFILYSKGFKWWLHTVIFYCL